MAIRKQCKKCGNNGNKILNNGLCILCESKEAAQDVSLECQWFALCRNVATTMVSHPVLGEVPTCARCAVRATGTGTRNKEFELYLDGKL